MALGVQAALQDAGYTTALASNGVVALKLLASEETFDALVTDIRLPGLITGWDIAIAARERYPEVPVVYVSGDSAADWTHKGVPGSRMFSNPVPEETIVKAVEEMVPRGDPQELPA